MLATRGPKEEPKEEQQQNSGFIAFSALQRPAELRGIDPAHLGGYMALSVSCPWQH